MKVFKKLIIIDDIIILGGIMNIESITGVGPKQAKVFNNLGIYTINDLLEYYPLIENQKEYIFNHPFDYLLTFIRTITKNFGYYIYQFTTGKTTICHNTISVDDTISFIYFIALIASLFFEESDNKYQKMLAFEGGNLFIAREEFEDQNITTKNNIKPEKHKFLKFFMILVLIGQIIIVLI